MTEKEARKTRIRKEGIEFYPPSPVDDTLTKEIIVEIVERNFDILLEAADSKKSTVEVEKLFSI